MNAIIATLRVICDTHNLKYTKASIVATVQMADGYSFIFN